jgi:hypothetical protein
MPATARRPYKKPEHRRERRTASGIPLPRLDGRKVAARRYRQLIETFEADLGGQLSTADVALVRQTAGLTLASEMMQADVAAGKRVDPDELVRVSSEARRCLEMLRTKVVKNKPAGQDALAAHIASKYGQRTDNAGVDDEEAAAAG